MIRTCEENPIVMNDDVEGDIFIAHYRSCTTDLCNGGDGITYNEVSIDGNWNGGIGGKIVPDRSSAKSMTKVNGFL